MGNIGVSLCAPRKSRGYTASHTTERPPGRELQEGSADKAPGDSHALGFTYVARTTKAVRTHNHGRSVLLYVERVYDGEDRGGAASTDTDHVQRCDRAVSQA